MKVTSRTYKCYALIKLINTTKLIEKVVKNTLRNFMEGPRI